MADWEKAVRVYDSVDQAKSAVNVLTAAGIDTSNVRLLDRSSFGPGVYQGQAGLWRRLFGENLWKDEAAMYGDTLRRGGAILAVRGPKDLVAKIVSTLDGHQAVNVPKAAAKNRTQVPAKAMVTPAQATTRGAEEVLRLAEEQLNVGKQMFETGALRIRRFVTEQPVEVQVKLHEEHVQVMRRTITDPNYVADIDWSDKEYMITETAEQAIVNKTARVVEEVAVRKEGTDRVETVRDSIRRQQIEVEKNDPQKKKAA